MDRCCSVIRQTWTPHPLQDDTDDWMRFSTLEALIQWPRPARHTAQTGFCGRKHSCKQLWQNLAKQWWKSYANKRNWPLIIHWLLIWTLAFINILVFIVCRWNNIQYNAGRCLWKPLNRASCKFNDKSLPQEGAGTCSLFEQVEEAKQWRRKLQFPGEASSLM